MSPSLFKPRVTEFLSRNWMWLLSAVAGVVFFDLIWAAAAYLIYPGYLDHGEPSVTLISWGLLDGVPAYPAFDQPNRTTNVYGAYTYLLHALSFLVAGPSMAAGKAASLLAVILIPVVMFFDQRRRGLEIGVVAFILAVGFILHNLPISIWNRPDSFIVLLVAGAVWAKNASQPGKPEWGKTLFIGVCGGLAVGFKIHAGIFIAPVALAQCMDSERGLRSLLAAAVVGLAVALMPFGLGVFSLGDFLSWFGILLKGKDSPFEFMIPLFRYSLLYLAPVALFALSYGSHKKAKGADGLKERIYLFAYLGCMAAAIYVGAKPGAGIHYLYPLLPMTIDLSFEFASRFPRRQKAVWLGVGAFCVLILALGIPVQKRFYRALHWQQSGEITAELRTIMSQNPGLTIEMGVGQDVVTYRNTLNRTLLVLAGHPYTFDSAVVMETSMLGIPLTDDTVAMVRGCSTDIWLIPKNEAPFAMTSYYGTPMFGPAFIEAFRRSYKIKASFDYFDVWGCKG